MQDRSGGGREEERPAPAPADGGGKRRKDGVAARRYTTMALAMRFTGLGWLVAVELVAPSMLGLWLDSMFDSRPLYTLCGLGLGTLLVPYSVWQYVKVAFKI